MIISYSIIKKIFFNFIILLILVTIFLNWNNCSNEKINEQQNKYKWQVIETWFL